MASCQEGPEWSQTHRKVPWGGLALLFSVGSLHSIGYGTASPGGRPWAVWAVAVPCWWCSGWPGCKTAHKEQKAGGCRGCRTVWDQWGWPRWRCLPACQSPCLWCCCCGGLLPYSRPAERRRPAAALTGSLSARHAQTWLPVVQMWWGWLHLLGPHTWDQSLEKTHLIIQLVVVIYGSHLCKCLATPMTSNANRNLHYYENCFPWFWLSLLIFTYFSHYLLTIRFRYLLSQSPKWHNPSDITDLIKTLFSLSSVIWSWTGLSTHTMRWCFRADYSHHLSVSLNTFACELIYRRLKWYPSTTDYTLCITVIQSTRLGSLNYWVELLVFINTVCFNWMNSELQYL